MEENKQKYEYSVPLHKLMEEFDMEEVYVPSNYKEIMVCTPDINRPGMQLIGFFNHFDNLRLQVMGIVEIMYLRSLPENERRKIYDLLLQRQIPALIICNRMKADASCIELAEKYGVPLLRTNMETSEFMASVITQRAIPILVYAASSRTPPNCLNRDMTLLHLMRC